MDEEFPWPKKGDNPFLVTVIEPFCRTWASLSWLGSMKVNDSFLATAFKEAGDMIIKELARGKNYPRADKFFLPTAYLYRHSLELKMKTIIRLGVSLKLIEKEQKLSRNLKREHGLYQLWNFVRRVVETYWPDGPQEDVKAAERIVQEFHQIDRTGQGLRYTKDQSGNSSLEQLPEAVQLTHVQDLFERLFNFLDCCESGLDHAIETRNERLSYYQDDFLSWQPPASHC